VFKTEVLQTVYKGRYVSILWPPTTLFGKSVCYLSVGLYIWKNDTATPEK